MHSFMLPHLAVPHPTSTRSHAGGSMCIAVLVWECNQKHLGLPGLGERLPARLLLVLRPAVLAAAPQHPMCWCSAPGPSVARR